MRAIEKMFDERAAEEATGLPQRGKLVFYRFGGEKIDAETARKMLDDGDTVEVPGAGAGSYHKVAEMLGLEAGDLLYSCSSAGDWTIQLLDGRRLQQSNRYPNFGFAYTIIP